VSSELTAAPTVGQEGMVAERAAVAKGAAKVGVASGRATLVGVAVVAAVRAVAEKVAATVTVSWVDPTGVT